MRCYSCGSTVETDNDDNDKAWRCRCGRFIWRLAYERKGTSR